MAIYNNNNGTLDLIAGGTLYADSPIGSIIPYGGNTAPIGWMICDGTSLLRASYPELFAVIGTAFGSADSTHFNIPDMRESVPKGAGLTGNTVGAHLDADGLVVGEFLDDRVKAHSHTVPQFVEGSPSRKSFNTVASSFGSDTGITSYETGSATTEVKSVGVNYIIKAKMVSVPSDFMSAVDEAVAQTATRFPDYAHPITITTKSWTATQDVFISALQTSGESLGTVTVDGNSVGAISDGHSNVFFYSWCGYVKKGSVIAYTLLDTPSRCKVFPLL